MNLSIKVQDKTIQQVIDLLNEKEDLDLTLNEVKGNQDLFNCLMNGAVVEFDENGMQVFIDPEECWNDDCYEDVEDYR